MDKIKVIELFAGVGGFRVGLERASDIFDTVWSNQFEPSTKKQHASEMYVKNFGEEGHANQDINEVEVKDIPDHDLLVGGFPCQDYSVACSSNNAKGIVGKKGVLWWEILRILEEKKDKAPKYLLLENVDRLLKSPSSQRGRDFAIILSSLNALGYAVEWRVTNGAEYGMPQRRKRIFIFASMKGTKPYNLLAQNEASDIINKVGLFAKAFPIHTVYDETIIEGKFGSDLVEVTENFNSLKPKQNAFLDAGYMIDGNYFTSKITPDYDGPFSVLGDFLEPEASIPPEFYIDAEALKKWTYMKGSKSFPRVSKTGHEYTYSEGSMGFPDLLTKPSRTIITGEGGPGASRFKHVVEIDGKHRRLVPIELERLTMFPDDHTLGVTDSKRAFLMGNALMVGVVEKFAETFLSEI